MVAPGIRSDYGATGEGLRRRPDSFVSATSWSVEEAYRDARRIWRTSPPATVAALRALLGEAPSAQSAGPLVVAPGDSLPQGGGTIRTEDGRELAAPPSVGPDIPFGYHNIHTRAGDRRLIVSPGRCHQPRGLQGWGWALQLYAARSRESWGMGDLADLRTVADWSADRGAGFILINPLHAATYSIPQEASPYFPSSRRWRNPLFLRVEDVPGAERIGSDLEVATAAGRALNSNRHIDRDRVFRLKIDALRKIWETGCDDPRFAAFRKRENPQLERYATFCAIAELHGVAWRDWPDHYRHPASRAVMVFAKTHEAEVGFHEWLQWLIDLQLEAAGARLLVMHDLAIAVDPQGADVWLHQDVYATGFSVGAPPDRFNTLGQNWAQPPFNPRRLQEEGYAPFIEILRSAFRGGGAIRFDHVMGLFRLWWIPAYAGPADGAYVRYPAKHLLDILALESHRAKGVVVGEDLGTVERGVRAELRRRRILSYRLMCFDRSVPMERYPREALTAVTTHDLPTVAGLWTRDDVRTQQDLGLEPRTDDVESVRERVVGIVGGDRGQPIAEVVVDAYRGLAKAPSRLLAAAMEDAACVVERPNMPGTTHETWPNWRIALPLPVEDVLAGPVAGEIADALGRARPRPTKRASTRRK